MPLLATKAHPLLEPRHPRCGLWSQRRLFSVLPFLLRRHRRRDLALLRSVDALRAEGPEQGRLGAAAQTSEAFPKRPRAFGQGRRRRGVERASGSRAAVQDGVAGLGRERVRQIKVVTSACLLSIVTEGIRTES